jgi:hypothetical protein
MTCYTHSDPAFRCALKYCAGERWHRTGQVELVSIDCAGGRQSALTLLIGGHELGTAGLTRQLCARGPMVVVIAVSTVTKRSANALDVANARVRRPSAVEHVCLLRTQATADRPSMDGRTGLLVCSLRRNSSANSIAVRPLNPGIPFTSQARIQNLIGARACELGNN